MKAFLRFARRVLIVSLLAAVVVSGYLIRRQSVDYENEPAAALSTGGAEKYYFSRLSNLEKHAYNSILSEIDGFPERIRVPQLTQSELGNVFDALLNDNPALYFTTRECTVKQSGSNAYFYAEYDVDRSVYAAQMTAVDSAARGFLATLDAASGEYALELAVHDFLVGRCAYSEDGGSLYDALVRGTASCEGYSKAAQYLFDRLGIACYVLCGVSENNGGAPENHMWNVVRVGGDWYNLDVTWDDPSNAGDKAVRHTYFNVSDAEISATHSDFENGNACVSTRMNYYRQSGVFFASLDSAAEEAVVSRIAAAADRGERFVEFRFSSAGAFDAAGKALFDERRVYRLQERAARLCSAKLKTGTTRYACDERFNIIQLYVPYA